MSSRLKKNKKKAINKVFLIIQVIISVIFLALCFYLDILPGLYLGAVVGILVVLALVNFALLRLRGGRVVSYVFSVIISLIWITTNISRKSIFRSDLMQH